jgi:hypothetical protein
MKKNLFLLLLGLNSLIYAQEPVNSKGAYLGQKPPGDTAQLFAPEIMQHKVHSCPTFTPDGKEIYWSSVCEPDELRRVMVMRYENDQWTAPQVASFSGKYHDDQPFISYDGRKLFFASKRPKTPGGQENLDLWYCTRKEHGWSEPTLLNNSIGMWTPSITRSGTLYFIDIIGDAQAKGYKENAVGIFRSELINGTYSTPELLPENINTKEFHDWTPFIAEDESYLIFSSDRAGGYGYGDLYISYRDKNGTWDEPINMGDSINTRTQERFPGVSPDGKYLFFTRWHGSSCYHDLYWIEAKAVLPHLIGTSERENSSRAENSIEVSGHSHNTGR